MGEGTGDLLDQLLQCSLCGAALEADLETAVGPECGGWYEQIWLHHQSAGQPPLVTRCVLNQVQWLGTHLHGLGPHYLLEYLSPMSSAWPTRSSQARILRVATPRDSWSSSWWWHQYYGTSFQRSYTCPPPCILLGDSWKHIFSGRLFNLTPV